MSLILTNPTIVVIGLAVFVAMIIIHLFGNRLARKRALLFGNFETLERAVGGKLLSKNFQMLAIRLLALFSLLLAMAGATLVYDYEQPSITVVLTVDTSLTMTASDYYPTRMEAAKNGMLTLVDRLAENTKVGIVTFADTAKVALDKTDDKRIVKTAIKRVGIASRAGTAIGNAIATSADVADRGGISVLLTDGNNNIGIDVKEGLKVANERNLTIFTIGIGNPEPSNPERLDEGTLKMIAKATGGEYFRAIDEDSISNITAVLAERMTLKKFESLSLSFHLIVIAFVILTAEWFLMNTRYRTIP